jgi:hypothetical protein
MRGAAAALLLAGCGLAGGGLTNPGPTVQSNDFGYIYVTGTSVLDGGVRIFGQTTGVNAWFNDLTLDAGAQSLMFPVTAGTSGQAMLSGGAGARATWGSAGGGWADPHDFATDRRQVGCFLLNYSSTQAISCGTAWAPTPSFGGCTSFAADTSTFPGKHYSRTATSTSINNDCGPTPGGAASAQFTSLTELPIFVARVATYTDIADMRWQIGLGSNAVTATTFALAETAWAVDSMTVAYESGVNSGRWMCCAANGTNQTCTNTGVTVATSTEYEIKIDASTASQITCTVNGTSVVHTTNLPTSTSALGWVAHVRTLAAAAKSQLIQYWGVNAKF